MRTNLELVEEAKKSGGPFVAITDEARAAYESGVLHGIQAMRRSALNELQSMSWQASQFGGYETLTWKEAQEWIDRVAAAFEIAGAIGAPSVESEIAS